MNNISIYSIPYEIFVKNIIKNNLIPRDNLDFKKFITYREVCKKFAWYFRDYSILRNIKLWLGIKYVKRLNEPFIEEWKYIQKLSNELYLKIYPTRLIDSFGGLDNLLSLPVLYGAKWYVINRMYTMKENYIGTKHDPWEKIKMKMTSPIMRGCDEHGIHFIALKYYNYTQKCFQLEFLYEGSITIQKIYLWTYISENNNSFIGSIGCENNPYKTLTHRNWLMLEYAIKNRKMFIANIPDYTKSPNVCRLPHAPYNDEYWSDEELSDDELINPDYTLKKINKKTVNILSLDY